MAVAGASGAEDVDQLARIVSRGCVEDPARSLARMHIHARRQRREAICAKYLAQSLTFNASLVARPEDSECPLAIPRDVIRLHDFPETSFCLTQPRDPVWSVGRHGVS
jgi:hypothetical protein